MKKGSTGAEQISVNSFNDNINNQLIQQLISSKRPKIIVGLIASRYYLKDLPCIGKSLEMWCLAVVCSMRRVNY